MPLLHNYFTQGKSWLEHGITEDQVQDRMAKTKDGSITLWEYSQKIIKAAVDRGYLLPTKNEDL